MNSDLLLQQDVIAGLNREPTVDAARSRGPDPALKMLATP
jgi:hypothetical protein